MKRSIAHSVFLSTLSIAALLSAQPNPAQSTSTPQATSIVSKPLAYEVVSIRPHNPDDHNGGYGFRADGVYGTNVPLTTVLYDGFNSDQVYGIPDWLKSDHYDFAAKVAPSDVAAYQKLPDSERIRMMHPVFEDRMKLKDHRETRELPVYALVLAKNKLKEATPGDTYAGSPTQTSGKPVILATYLQQSPVGENRIVSQGASIAQLLQQLSIQPEISRRIVDKTGLTGKYDFTLHWTSASSDQENAAGPSIFTALQEQLGLKLESTKGPVEVLVIDHIERPSEN
jgi:uncharacterized protein (TIGR03435 family)